MTDETRLNANRLAHGELVSVFAVVAVCIAITLTVSGVPGGPRRIDSGSALVRLIGNWSRVFLRSGLDGRLRQGLERPGSETWNLYAGPKAPARVQAAAATYLGRVGTRNAADTLVTLCGRADGEVGRAAEKALARIIERNRGRWIYARIGTLARSTPLSVAARRRIVQSLSEVGDPNSISVLSHLAGSDTGLRAQILGVVARLAEGNPQALLATRGLPAKMAKLLIDRDPLIRREGTLAAGRDGDLAHVPTLIGLLKDGHRGVRGNAHWALTHSLGINLPAEHGSWQSWHAMDSEWWTLNQERIREHLAGTDEALKAAAIRDVSAHPLARQDVRFDLETLAFRGNTGVRRIACFALGRLRSRASIRVLIGILEDADATVREAAWHALKELTGLDVAPISDAWTTALASRR